MSEWSTTQNDPSYPKDLTISTNKNKTVLNDISTQNTNQHSWYDQENKKISPSKLSEYCRPLSPFLYGLLIGVLTAGLILATVIALWLTSSEQTLTTETVTAAATVASTASLVTSVTATAASTTSLVTSITVTTVSSTSTTSIQSSVSFLFTESDSFRNIIAL
ncbi:unnamed protein product [Adineta steineri]|uniref:CLLAC-motif containing domain-containing protein n=2 Tax=Adineta steineri TaxID=433720 RepID=A0A819TAE5_9BILA|nr:unnamed protein product [Adineta steineri]CAF4073745.1 unnamed protein product [Adineta steineri]